MDSQRCVLCDIGRGVMGARKIYEDEHTVGALDIKPRFAKGQCVVFPKKHIERITDLQDEEAVYLFRAVKEVYNKMEKLYKPERVALFMRGQTFPHIHVILFPVFPGMDDILGHFFKAFVFYEPLAKISEAELDEIAEQLRQQ